MNELVVFLTENFSFPKSIYIIYVPAIFVFCYLKVSCHDMSATAAMMDIISNPILLTLKSKRIPINGNITKVKQCSVTCTRQRTSPNNVTFCGD